MPEFMGTLLIVLFEENLSPPLHRGVDHTTYYWITRVAKARWCNVRDPLCKIHERPISVESRSVG